MYRTHVTIVKKYKLKIWNLKITGTRPEVTHRTNRNHKVKGHVEEDLIEEIIINEETQIRAETSKDHPVAPVTGGTDVRVAELPDMQTEEWRVKLKIRRSIKQLTL